MPAETHTQQGPMSRQEVFELIRDRLVDILEIDSCDQEDSGPMSGMGWGYTGVFANKNGGGFLTERFPGVPLAGDWREIVNSDAPLYGGSGVGNLGRVRAAELTP